MRPDTPPSTTREPFPWNKDYQLGLESIDEQHREIFDAINSLCAAVQEGRSGAELDGIFFNLEVSVETHFWKEERMLAEYGYPHLAKHKAAHQEFVNLVLEMREQCLREISVDKRLPMVLGYWFAAHVQRDDNRWFTYLA